MNHYMTAIESNTQTLKASISRIARLLGRSVLLRLVHNAEDKVDNDGQQEDDGEDRRAESVVKASLATHANRLGAPVVGDEGVDHGEHGHAGEEEGGDEGDAVTKVEHANGEGTNDDGEVEP